jgi:murein DD-endopeptidase MepM/ murein hydrolase activator NlpD
MVQLYEQGPTSTLNAILASGTFDQLWTRITAAKRVADAQSVQIGVVTAERQRVEQLVAAVSAGRLQQQQVIARQQADEQSLVSYRSSEADLQQQLADARVQDQVQLALQQKSKQEVDAEVASDATALSAAKRRKAEAEAAAAAAARGNGGSFTGGGNGHFVWPERAPLSQYFGCTSWPYENYDSDCPVPHRFHTGLDIAGPWGAPLVAGDTGIAYVYYSGYGYGNHVIIVHDNGWTTLYGHMSSFAVSSGQVVGRGQLIGYEGSTGNSSGPHVHFEVRLNGTPVNPLAYLP